MLNEKELAKKLLTIMEDNGFKTYGSPHYFNNSLRNIQLDLPTSREIVEIANYYQSLANTLKNFEVKIIETMSSVSGREFEIKFSEKTWEELKMYNETQKYNL